MAPFSRSQVVAAVVAEALLAPFSWACRSATPIQAAKAPEVAITVRAPMERYDSVSPDDQTICAGASEYAREVTSLLRQALPQRCPLCDGKGFRFQVLLRNDMWKQQASFLYRLPDDGTGPGSTYSAEVALEAILRMLDYPPLPLQRSQCVFEIQIGP